MSNLFTRGDAGGLRKEVLEEKNDRAVYLPQELLAQFDEIALTDVYVDEELELLLLEQERLDIKARATRVDDNPNKLCRFSPSGATKCKRELFFRFTGAEKDTNDTKYPYHKRWASNGSAVHSRAQRDLLFSEKYNKIHNKFKVRRTKSGMPAWENNIKRVMTIEHNGEQFQLSGMTDGYLVYEDGTTVGFEFKTKSTTVSAIGTFKLKAPADSHKAQTVAYALMYGVDEYIICYESLAKDGWSKKDLAKPDMRAFYHKVEEADKVELLDRFAEITKAVRTGELPDGDADKCLFCEFKGACGKVGDMNV